jgi:hypothetical protein
LFFQNFLTPAHRRPTFYTKALGDGPGVPYRDRPQATEDCGPGKGTVMKTAGIPIDEVALENRDSTLRRVMTHGPLFGIPSVWAAALVVGLVSGLPFVTAAAVAVIPAVVGGPYFGGLAVLFHLQLMGEVTKSAPKHSYRPHLRRHRVKAA